MTATAVALVAWPMLSLFFYLTFESLHPEAIGWDEKTAWRKCEGAIAGRIEWPEQHGARCEAMSLCANEAPLTPAQSAQLADENRRGGCEAF